MNLKPMIPALACALIIAAITAFGPSGYGVLKFLGILLVFFLGVMAALYLQDSPPDLEDYLDSDWRNFELLVELTPEQIAKLQSLTRRADLKPDALAWLEGQWSLKPGAAEDVLKFFVKSGWASGGNTEHANDPEWRWEI